MEDVRQRWDSSHPGASQLKCLHLPLWPAGMGQAPPLKDVMLPLQGQKEPFH